MSLAPPDPNPEYPHLKALLDGMQQQPRILALFYLSMLPPEAIQDIESKIPKIVELEENNDEEGLRQLLIAFGADAETANMLIESRDAIANDTK